MSLLCADNILERRLRGERLSFEDGVALWGADLFALARAATAYRDQVHRRSRVITYVVDRNISYTNACIADCDFCAFYVTPTDTERQYTLTIEQILKKVEELEAVGGTQVLLQGGLNPKLGLDFYVRMVRSIRQAFPNITIHSFSPTEIEYLTRREKTDAREVFRELKAAGLNSMPGGGGEILVDRVRNILSPKKVSACRWLDIMETAHSSGLPTTATMVVGHVETKEERIEHLLALRELQDRTGGFRAFIVWTMATEGTRISHLRMAGGEDYLRTLAVARLVLDNVPNFQAGWVTEGHKMAQLALAFGANDLGGTLMEEEVVSATGLRYRTTEADLIRLIRGAGCIPAKRNTAYQILAVHN